MNAQMQAKAQLAQQAALLRAGQLIEAEDASKVVAHYLTVLGKRLLQLPNRFRINFGRDNNHQPMAEWLEDEIYSALEEVSELPEAVRRGKVFDVDGD